MLKMLSAFAALSMCGTVVLSLLPEGGLKRTAGMAVGLLTLMCWAEGISTLLHIHLPDILPTSVLAPTAYSMDAATAEASLTLSGQWEVAP